MSAATSKVVCSPDLSSAQRGWTIDRLAEDAGMSRKSVINAENGHHRPTLDTLHGLAHGLKVPLSELVLPLCARHSRARR